MAAGAGAEPQPLAQLRDAAARLLDESVTSRRHRATRWSGLRREYLGRQLEAVDARLRMLAGERFTFDEESHALYDAVAPTHAEAYFARTLAELDARCRAPAPWPSGTRRSGATSSSRRDRLDAVFQAAIDACRARTREHMPLPADESFTVEYVTGKSWSGYNWYQGGTTA